MSNKLSNFLQNKLNEHAKHLTEWGTLVHNETGKIYAYSIMDYFANHMMCVCSAEGGFSEAWDIESAKEHHTFYPYITAHDYFFEKNKKDIGL